MAIAVTAWAPETFRGAGGHVSLQAVYECDKRCAAICTDMQRTGFAFDLERASEYEKILQAREAEATREASEAMGREINPHAHKDLAKAIFKEIGAPVLLRSKLTRRPSLGVDAMRAYATHPDARLRRLALAVLDARRARKVKSTYVTKIANKWCMSDGRVHPTWKNAGPVSGRWACSDPNIMNLARPEHDPTAVRMPSGAFEGGVRTLYVPAPGFALVSVDAKQLEMRVAAYASGDEGMIAACASSDLHAANAAIIFGDAYAQAVGGEKKALRTLAKSAGFAVCYMAQAETVYARLIADGQHIKLRQVQAMLRNMRKSFAGYYAWQTRKLLDCTRTGYVYTPILGRRRWLGHTPAPTECANHPIQGGAADLMNLRLPPCVERMRREIPSARLVAQVHDEVVFEAPITLAERCGEVIREVFEEPITISSSGRDIVAAFPVDVEIGDRWS